MKKRKCTSCGREKTLDGFNKDKRGRYGVTARCKDCTAEYARLYRQRNLEKLRRQDRERSKNLEYQQRKSEYYKKYRETARGQEVAKKARDKYRQTEQYKKRHVADVIKYRKTDSGRSASRRASKKYRASNRVKVAAHTAARAAVKNGVLLKGSCVVCGTKNDVHAHHDDYTKPLGVTWLCRTHHGQLHRKG